MTRRAKSWYSHSGAVQLGHKTGDKLGFRGTTPIATPAAYTITNWTSDRALDCDSTTAAELADVLATLIDDLIDHGILQGTVST